MKPFLMSITDHNSAANSITVQIPPKMYRQRKIKSVSIYPYAKYKKKILAISVCYNIKFDMIAVREVNINYSSNKSNVCRDRKGLILLYKTFLDKE